MMKMSDLHPLDSHRLPASDDARMCKPCRAAIEHDHAAKRRKFFAKAAQHFGCRDQQSASQT